MNLYLSDKFRILSLLSAILVLYIHSGFHDNEILGMPVNHATQNVISGWLGSLAVPLFFMLSGFLFFLKMPYGMKSILQKMRKRVRTVLIPYLIGCSFCALFFIATAALPFTSRFMNGELSFLSLPLPDLIWKTFIHPPLAFQLWFLQHLIAIVALAPLLYVALTKMGWAFAILSFAASTVDPTTHNIMASFFWFSIGGLTALSPSRDKIISRQFDNSTIRQFDNSTIRQFDNSTITFIHRNVLIVSFAIFVISRLLSGYIEIQWLSRAVRILSVFSGIVSVWLIYDNIVGADFKLSNRPLLSAACGYSFFIYLFHVPTLNIPRKIIVAILGKTSFGYLTSYLLSPFIFAAVAIIIGVLLRRYANKLFCIMTGGR